MYIQISRYQINKILQLKALVNLEYTYTRINKQLVKEERTKTELMNRSFEVSNLDRTKNIEVIRFVLLKVEINTYRKNQCSSHRLKQHVVATTSHKDQQ